MTAPKKRTPPAATGGVQGDHVAGDQGKATTDPQTIATAIEILNGIRRAPWANESIAPTMSMLGLYDVACLPVPALVATVQVLAERIDPHVPLDPALVVPVSAMLAAIHRASAPDHLAVAVGHIDDVSPRLADIALARAGIPSRVPT